MYYLAPTADSILVGDLYQINKGKRELKQKDFNFVKESDIYIKGAIICQWLTEGQTLEILSNFTELPSKYEFFLWLEESPPLAMLYEKAQFRRALSLTETLYADLQNITADLDAKELKKTLFSLNELRKLVKNKDAAVHTVINTRVFLPPIMKKWYNKE